jgi:hypothetical protein
VLFREDAFPVPVVYAAIVADGIRLLILGPGLGARPDTGIVLVSATLLFVL